MMAEAEAKITGRPGVVMVTRGPGAMNAAAGLHIARHDGTPLLLFIGQVSQAVVGREAFQEIDYQRAFGGLAKLVEVITVPERAAEIIARAFATALAGRQGPVVIVLPEDVLAMPCFASPPGFIRPREVAPDPALCDALVQRLRSASHPLCLLGGGRWSKAAIEKMETFAQNWSLPVAVAFRRQHLFDHNHPLFVGRLAPSGHEHLFAHLAQADCLCLFNSRLSSFPSRNYSALSPLKSHENLVHIHACDEELGRVYQAGLSILATPEAMLDALLAAEPPKVPRWRQAAIEARKAFEAHSTPRTAQKGHEKRFVDLEVVMDELAKRFDQSTVLTNGAGNFAIWPERFWRYGGFATQIAATSGYMGYGLPAAIAAAINLPERQVIAFCGDGCMQMTMAELTLASALGVKLIVFVIENGRYGTIWLHQKTRYPGRETAVGLANPDFVTFAKACGASGIRVEHNAQIAPALDAAKTAGKTVLIALRCDPDLQAPPA